jgi:hypothetical protein
MSIRVKVTCPLHGPESVWDHDLVLHIGRDEDWYGFRCPACSRHVWCSADPRAVRLLVALGVPTRHPGIAGPITGEEINLFIEALKEHPRVR